MSHHALRGYERAASDLEAAKRLDPDNVALHVDYRTLRECCCYALGPLWACDGC